MFFSGGRKPYRVPRCRNYGASGCCFCFTTEVLSIERDGVDGTTNRRSQILIVPSSLPVTSHLPSLWKQMAVILPLCPSYMAI